MNSIAFTDKTIYTTPSKLPDTLINEIIEHISSLEPEMQDSSVDGNNDPIKSVRSSKNVWMNTDEWIAGIVHNMMISANNEYFLYDLKHFDTQLQAAVYEGDQKDFYTWHVDNGTPVTRPRFSDGTLLERKLSCSLILSDPDEYEGGELQFHYSKAFFKSLKPEKGTAVIFPAWLPHRVRPVKSGKRISLVAWMNGPAFK